MALCDSASWFWRRKANVFRRIFPFVALCAALAMSSAPASAQGAFEMVERLILDGRLDEARIVGRHLGTDEQQRALSLTFVEALIARSKGEHARAVGLFREVLDQDPGFARVRQELAHTLFLMGEAEASRHHFEFLARTVDSPGHAALYDRYLTAIRLQRPWTLEGSVGFAPSTNINDGTGSQIVDVGGIPFIAQNLARSGVGLSYSGAGTYRFDLDPRHAVTLGGAVAGSSYWASEFDRLALDGFAEFAGQYGRWRLGVGAGATRHLAGWDGHNWSVGPHISARRDFGRHGTAAARLGWRRIDYDRIDAFDGHESELALQYRYAFSPSLSATGALRAAYTRTRFDFHDHVALRPHLAIDYTLSPQIVLHAHAAVAWRSYGGDFPLLGTARKDTRLDLGVAVTLQRFQFNDFVPRLGYAFHATQSNVGLYQRDRHSLTVAFTRRY